MPPYLPRDPWNRRHWTEPSPPHIFLDPSLSKSPHAVNCTTRSEFRRIGEVGMERRHRHSRRIVGSNSVVDVRRAMHVARRRPAQRRWNHWVVGEADRLAADGARHAEVAAAARFRRARVPADVRVPRPSRHRRLTLSGRRKIALVIDWTNISPQSINQPIHLSIPMADPKILKGGGRQFISPVLIYRKCTQRSVVLLHDKRRLYGEKIEPIGGRPISIYQPISITQLNSTTTHRWYTRGKKP